MYFWGKILCFHYQQKNLFTKADVIVNENFTSVVPIMCRNYTFSPWEVIILKMKIMKFWMLIILRGDIRKPL